MEETDVLIVGGGPAGLATAELASRRSRVLVVHKDAEIGKPVRTSGGSWLDDVIKLGIPASCYKVINSVQFAGPTTKSIFDFKRRNPVVLDVTATYRYLADLAEASGAKIQLSTKLVSVEINEDGCFTCRLESRGEVRSIRTRYLVDASGFQRAVLNRLGLVSKPQRYGIGAEGEYEDLSDRPNQATLFVGTRYAPTGYGWIFPTNHGTVRVGVGVTRPVVTVSPAKLLADFMQSVEVSAGLGIKVGRLVEEHGGVVPAEGPLRRVIYDAVIAVGDSAGQVLPLVGEGIRFSIMAGRKAGAALDGALDEPNNAERHLARYQAWWVGSYFKRFQLAQAVNLRITQYEDAQWDAGVKRISIIDAEMLGSLLRADALPWSAAKFLMRHPLAASSYLAEKMSRHLRK